MRQQNIPVTSTHTQKGFALVIALGFLLILTILGVAALASNSSEEKMSYSAADYSRALQAADSAVLQGEQWIGNLAANSLPSTSATMSNASACSAKTLVATAGLPLATSVSSSNTWSSFTWGTYARCYTWDYAASTARNNVTLLRTSNNTTSGPRYVVEELGPDTTSSLVLHQGSKMVRYYYRVTAQSYGASPVFGTQNLSAYAQSIYSKPFQVY